MEFHNFHHTPNFIFADVQAPSSCHFMNFGFVIEIIVDQVRCILHNGSLQ